MVCRPRSLSIGSTLAFGAAFLASAGPEARGQIFDYAVQDSGGKGALGTAVARIGDIDGDGCEDFIVGEPDFGSSGNPGLGLFRIVSGKTGSQIVAYNGNPDSNLGAAVAGRIDVDGDGFLDVLIGAPYDDSAAADGGVVFAYSPHLDTFPLTWWGTAAFGHLGSSVRSLEGDVDSDGVDDFIVGSPGADEAEVISSKRKVLIFSNTGQPGAGFGTAVCRGGDLDNDHVVDYLVGSPDYVDSGGSRTGRVAAFSGKTGNKIWTVDGTADSRFGVSLAQPGDLDGDGQGDIVVGAETHLDKNGNKTGCATVLSGANASVLYKVFGDDAGDTFGHCVHGAGGDVDDDGTVDFIVGAPQLASSDVGFVRVISGATGATLFTYTEHSNDPNTKSDYGFAVAGGDFDNDGRTDVLIGGSNFNGGDGIVETWLTAVASWNNYGNGWPGTNGVPGFVASHPPVVGGTLVLDLDNSAGIRTAGELLIGFTKDSIPSGKGGTILLDAAVYLPITIDPGGLTITDQVPDNPALYGFHVYLQAIEGDIGASKRLSFTRGLDLFFGFN
jgi:FG-GAP repeat protein